MLPAKSFLAGSKEIYGHPSSLCPVSSLRFPLLSVVASRTPRSCDFFAGQGGVLYLAHRTYNKDLLSNIHPFASLVHS